MNRKQVNAFLKIMSKDTIRPVLCSAYIDKWNGNNVIVATDGYMLTALKFDDIDDQYVGKRISREAIEKWYKLADGKSRFTGEIIQELMEDDVHNARNMSDEYPKWQQLMPSLVDTDAFIKDTSISFNADFTKIAQDLLNSGSVTMKLYGKLSPMIIDNEVAMIMIMPMKG